MSAFNITLGCDPEIFVKEKLTGNFYSAHGLVPGNKDTPFVVPNGAVQVDGLALEFNIDPASSKEDWVDSINSVYGTLVGMLPDHLEVAPGEPVAHFPVDHYIAQPHDALELGCEPDFNAYTMTENPRPNTEDKPMRTAAGHIHIGWRTGGDNDPAHFLHCCEMVKFLDALVGVPSLAYDDSSERRTLYGQAGAFRVKDYGLEYRVLSNKWCETTELMGLVYEQTTSAVNLFLSGARLPEDALEGARNIINENQTQAVDDFMGYVFNVIQE